MELPLPPSLIMEDKLIRAVGNGAILFIHIQGHQPPGLAWREVSLEVREPGNIMFRIIFYLCISDGIHLAIQKSNNKMQEERGFVVVRSDLIGCWLRLAPSANSTPPSVRHAFRRPLMDGCSGRGV